jgi:hypothetical protein
LAVYQKHDTANDQTIQIILGVSMSRSEIGSIVRQYAQDSPSSAGVNFSHHSMVLEHVISSWKKYMAAIYDTVEAKVSSIYCHVLLELSINFAGPKKSGELPFQKRREDLNQFRDRPDLIYVEESLRNLPLMIMSLASTIRRIQKECGQGFPQKTSSMEYVTVTNLFEHQLEETQLLSKRIEIFTGASPSSDQVHAGQIESPQFQIHDAGCTEHEGRLGSHEVHYNYHCSVSSRYFRCGMLPCRKPGGKFTDLLS